MQTHQQKKLPSKWPFHSRPSRGKCSHLTRGTMVADICLVAAWGATIPGLMWLGAAGGF